VTGGTRDRGGDDGDPARSVISAELRRRLVGKLESASAIRSDAVRDAFLTVPREIFIPAVADEQGIGAVYEDEAYPTKTDQRGDPISSSSQPQIMALMLEALRLAPAQRILEVGAGTGYNAALISAIVGPRGRVTSIELDPDIAADARGAVAEAGQRANIAVGDGRNGWERGAPYDAIIATASSLEIPRAFLDQLREGGLLVLPLRITDALPFRQLVVTFERSGHRLRSVAVIPGGFMRMRDRPDDPSVPWAAGKIVEIRSGIEQTVAALSGSTLSHLSPDSRRRLLGLMMSRPRSRDLGIRVSGRRQWDLESFIALAVPEGRLVGCVRDDLSDVLLFSTAVPAILDRDGKGLACLAGAKTITRIDAYGGHAPERLLHEAVGTWLRWERPGVGQLRIEVTYAQPRTKHWRTNRRGSCFVSYDWVGSPLGVSPGPG
jgi:protein-L-isoaspartate(D-aspartate) O-methyltransferase